MVAQTMIAAASDRSRALVMDCAYRIRARLRHPERSEGCPPARCFASLSMTEIEELLQREIDVGSFPAASWAVGTLDRIVSEGALGYAVAVPLRIPAAGGPIFRV